MTRSEVKVTRPLKLEIPQFSSIFKIRLLQHFECELANDYWFWNYGTISKFCMDQIFDICPSFCVIWLRTWKGPRFRRSRLQSRTGLIFWLTLTFVIIRDLPLTWFLLRNHQANVPEMKFRLLSFLSRNTWSRKHDVGVLFTWAGGAILTLMLLYRSLYITWQQHHSG